MTATRASVVDPIRSTRPTSSRLARFAVAATLVGLGLRYPLPAGLTIGSAAAIALLPFWWSSLRAYVGTGVFMLGALLLVSEIWLTELSSVDHNTSDALLISEITLVLGLLAGVGVFLWARQLESSSWAAIWFGIGMLLNGAFLQDGKLFAENPWKFGFATAAAVIGLALAHRVHKRWLELVVLMGLIAAAILNDARSSFAILFVTVILTAVQLRPDRASRRASTLRFIVAIGGISVIVFNIGQTLILNGYLGDAARERSVEQIDTSGSLLLGGRPELAATAALMQERPIGFGAGVIPTLSDVTAAKTGMAAIGYQPNNGYVENYMFGGRIELHSVIGDLWARAGIPGLIFAAIIAILTINGLSDRLARNAASSLSIYATVWLFWNLLFSPLYSSLLLTTL